MKPFKAYLIEQGRDAKVGGRMTTLAPEQLDAGEVTIRVHYSSINYKDALAATGTGKIIRRFPCVGGVDLAGVVVLRGVSLLGIDSGYIGFPTRQRVWDRLASDLKPRHPAALTRAIDFAELPHAFDAFIQGRAKGRTVVRIGT